MLADRESQPLMIAGVAFDLYAGLFTPSEVASFCGVKRPVIDTMATRGLIVASRRERLTHRPLFSFRDVFKVRMMRSLAPVGVGLGDSSSMADEAKTKKMPESEAMMDDLAQIADAPATKGEWMWAMARSIERGKPLLIYAYTTRAQKKWQFDMHIESAGVDRPTEPPCFGWETAHVYVPVGNIFIAVYIECKKSLGLTMDRGT